jgi:hypothetical protein
MTANIHTLTKNSSSLHKKVINSKNIAKMPEYLLRKLATARFSKKFRLVLVLDRLIMYSSTRVKSKERKIRSFY